MRSLAGLNLTAIFAAMSIDSPVAGYLMAKRGVEVNCVYYHSHPYTSERAKDKVKDLAKILAPDCSTSALV